MDTPSTRGRGTVVHSAGGGKLVVRVTTLTQNGLAGVLAATCKVDTMVQGALENERIMCDPAEDRRSNAGNVQEALNNLSRR